MKLDGLITKLSEYKNPFNRPVEIVISDKTVKFIEAGCRKLRVESIKAVKGNIQITIIP